MARLSLRVLIPRILYSTSYTILLLIVLLLLVVTPGDHVYQTLSDSKLGNIFVVGVTYFVTAVLALFIYASRLYTNRTTLAAIPKPFLPIEPGEVSASIRKIIVRNLERSALVAWDSRPRDLTNELTQGHRTTRGNGRLAKQKTSDSWPLNRINSRLERNRSNSPVGIPIDPYNPPWGNVEHPGWSAPTMTDLPNLQFATVVAELPNLLEAKAVSLAPQLSSAAPAISQADVVALLQRSRSSDTRTYVSRLEALRLLGSEDIHSLFINLYEQAKFSGNVLTEREFQELMAVFAQLIDSMNPLDESMIAAMVATTTEGSDNSSLDAQRPGSSANDKEERRHTARPEVTEAYHEMDGLALSKLSVRHDAASSSGSSLRSVVVHRDE